MAPQPSSGDPAQRSGSKRRFDIDQEDQSVSRKSGLSLRAWNWFGVAISRESLHNSMIVFSGSTVLGKSIQNLGSDWSECGCRLGNVSTTPRKRFRNAKPIISGGRSVYKMGSAYVCCGDSHPFALLISSTPAASRNCCSTDWSLQYDWRPFICHIRVEKGVQVANSLCAKPLHKRSLGL